MADRVEADEIRAAGAVLWHPAGLGAEVGIIHRPKYDDWSFAKGKLEPGEHVLLAAVREVAEETGLRVTLGRRLPPVQYISHGVPKRVDYWVGALEPTSAGFAVNNEVDELAWLAPTVAGARLSYPGDVATLDEFTAGPAQTFPLILIRHASAGAKSQWPNDDVSRPLDPAGARDAETLAGLVRCFGVCRVISSPAERCVATVRPYAVMAGADIEVEPAFWVVKDGSKADVTQEPSTNPAAGVAMAQLAAADTPVVICAHRENLPGLVEAACAELGAASPAGLSLRKAEFLVLHRAGRQLAAIERYHPDRPGLSAAGNPQASYPQSAGRAVATPR